MRCFGAWGPFKEKTFATEKAARNVLTSYRDYMSRGDRVKASDVIEDMIRTIPSPRYGCATCGEHFDAQDLHWHPFRTDAGRVVLQEGWHCYLCETEVKPEYRVTLDKIRSVAGTP